MKISILTPDLSGNCLGRAYLLAKILQRRYEVEIVGPIFGDGIWEPVADLGDLEYKSIKIGRIPKSYWQVKNLLKKIDGDVIYASKPLFTSFGLGLIKKLSNGRPLILDIDDWQMGFRKEQYKNLSPINRFKFLVGSTLQFYGTTSYWNTLFGEMLSHLADEITVSNNFLKEKFGGTIVWHSRDTNVFDPKKFDKDFFRMKYRIEKNKKIVMFFGTPNVHKGIEDLINAIKLTDDQSILLVIVGISRDQYSQKLAEIGKIKLGKKFLPFGLQPFEKVPEFLAMADIVVIPQKRNFSTLGQVPVKVFDAMAMAKPIIATDVSDLPLILDGCGWIVEPGNPEQLAESIQYALNNPEAAEEIGWNARQKCIDKYSWDAMEKILINIFRKYE
ncbi:MAG: glycosyl transferase [Candidatus Latescibacterota bacterium]|nr:MAG: glycosyl transferase [Candidatus Latescibacterota bacterium]